jgi:hypothetical protein
MNIKIKMMKVVTRRIFKSRCLDQGVKTDQSDKTIKFEKLGPEG